MLRRIHISLRPSEALTALVTLHNPAADVAAPPGASAAAHAFGARLGQEVARAFEAHARALDVLGQCLDWLERRGLAAVDRPRARGPQRAHTWQCAAEVRADVRALSREVAEAEGDDRARASAWALRAVLRHLAGAPLHTCEVRAGNERIPAAEALAAYDAALASSGYGPHAAPPARLAHLAPRAKRRDEPAVEPPPPPPAPSKTKAAPRRAEAPKASKGAGFGGLPDDAMPEDRRTGDVFGPRGLTLDAEFFLVEAAIAEWPCDVKALERGRRLVVSKLHPDRAGEASTTAFHRAIKGHAELLKKLPAAPVAPERPVVTEPAPPSATTSAVVEKPAAPPKRPRARAAATPAQAVTAPPPPAATGTTFEWPPRPAPPTPPVTPAEQPAAAARARAPKRPRASASEAPQPPRVRRTA